MPVFKIILEVFFSLFFIWWLMRMYELHRLPDDFESEYPIADKVVNLVFPTICLIVYLVASHSILTAESKMSAIVAVFLSCVILLFLFGGIPPRQTNNRQS